MGGRRIKFLASAVALATVNTACGWRTPIDPPEDQRVSSFSKRDSDLLGFDSAPGGPTEPTSVGFVSGSSGDTNEVSTSSTLEAAPGLIYVAYIATKPDVAIDSIQGLGVTWQRVGEQCSARGTNAVAAWIGVGTTPFTGSVRAQFGLAPERAVIVVGAYVGVDDVNPISSVTRLNRMGVNGSCAETDVLADDAGYYLDRNPDLTQFAQVAVCMRNREHNAVGEGYTEMIETHSSFTGDGASLAVNSAIADPNIPFSGGFNAATDWALLGVEFNALVPE